MRTFIASAQGRPAAISWFALWRSVAWNVSRLAFSRRSTVLAEAAPPIAGGVILPIRPALVLSELRIGLVRWSRVGLVKLAIAFHSFIAAPYSFVLGFDAAGIRAPIFVYITFSNHGSSS